MRHKRLDEIVEKEQYVLNNEERLLKKFENTIRAGVIGVTAAYLTLASYAIAHTDKIQKAQETLQNQNHQNYVEPIIGIAIVGAGIIYEILKPQKTKTIRDDPIIKTYEHIKDYFKK